MTDKEKAGDDVLEERTPAKPEQTTDSDATDGAKAGANRDAREAQSMPEEFGGYDGPEPTRYGDWQHRGRVSDF